MSGIVITTLWMYGLAIAVSMAVAVVIRLIVLALDAIGRRPAAATTPARPAAAAADDAVPAEHVAAIAAAIHAVLGAHRIVHIHDAHHHEGWVTEGRQAHHHSHSPEHHPRR